MVHYSGQVGVVASSLKNAIDLAAQVPIHNLEVLDDFGEDSICLAQIIVSQALLAALVDREETIPDPDNDAGDNEMDGPFFNDTRPKGIHQLYHRVLNAVIENSHSLPHRARVKNGSHPVSCNAEGVEANSNVLDDVMNCNSILLISQSQSPLKVGVGPKGTKVDDYIVQHPAFRTVWRDVAHTEMGFVVRPVESGRYQYIGPCFMSSIHFNAIQPKAIELV
ncbi:hypothetical protein N0V90_002345 [Kalmusia sp. IMI 367209]|nr:hypothetical protein N0V90_002345 [Kalmusia sp. IMI 367209]